MATLKEIIEYSKANPTSSYAKTAQQHLLSGGFDAQAQQEGVDLSWAGRPKLAVEKKITIAQPKTTMEKIASFTGGEKIAQGIGQAIANPKISKQLDEVQKQAMDIQGQLLVRIKEKKAFGEDTTKLNEALKGISIAIQTTGQETGELLNQKGLTTKQILGDALRLGTTILGTGGVPGIAKNVVAAKTLGTGIVQGAKAGAITGSIYGASSGVSGALKKDKTTGKIIKGGVGGALMGAGTGIILGGIAGGISGKIQGARLAKQTKENKFALDLVSPKATDKVKQVALEQGRVSEQGLLHGGKILPSKRDFQLAESVKGIVSAKNSPIQNIDSIDKTVREINTGVKAYVANNKVPFNTSQLQSQLNKGKDELKLIFASDKNAKKTYDAVVSEFIKHVKTKDTSGLLDARQVVDKIPAIKKLLASQGLGENTKKEVVLTVREMANRYIANLLPKGNIYRSTILNESKMIETIGNIAEKNIKILETGKIQMLINEYPLLKWFIGGLAGGGMIAGGAIISSID